MTKLEIVKQIARETGIEATTVSAVVEGFMEGRGFLLCQR